MADIDSTDAIPSSSKLLCVLLFCGILFQYAGRSSVSVVLVDLQMPPENKTNTSVSKSQIQYSQFQVGAILSSVYIGLLPSSFIGGYLAYRYSAMRIFLASIGASSIAHCVAPFMFGRFETAITQRVVAGLVEGLCEPAAYGVLSQHLTPKQSAGVSPYIFAGCMCVSGCLFVAAFTSNSLVAGCFVAVGFGSSAARAAVSDANPFDIAHQYASVLTGLSRVLSRVVGLTFPLLVTALTKNKSRQEWSRVLLIKACVFAAAAVFYGVFGSGEEQSWAVAVSHDQNEVIEVDEIQRGGSKNDKVNDEKRPLVIK
ncbi:PREDICTED: vesicular glutamate transporter 2.1-like [Branchiostoma belcheri]|uniref:Vesicular glutamate transporter 2.1-like n=1 Tax=Branchiostoma belcheri TaxID=7741 RepID=A0A6P4Y9G9_BRABE|nr:PREDICTED: vesicular glutamate transporter 2.1-like [Branchiostoma belcheri]